MRLPKAPVAEDYRMLGPMVLSPNMYKGVNWATDVMADRPEANGRPVRKCDYEFQLEDLLYELQSARAPSLASKAARLLKAANGGINNPQVPSRLCTAVPMRLRAYRAIVAESCLDEEKVHSFPENKPADLPQSSRDVVLLGTSQDKAYSDRTLRRLVKKYTKYRAGTDDKLSFSWYRTPTPHSSCKDLVLERWLDDRSLRDQEVLMSRSEADKTVFVAFRQTDSNLEWVTTNLRVGLSACSVTTRDCEDCPMRKISCGRVHAGFKAAWDGLAELHGVYRKLDQYARAGYRIVFTGHSLGAGMSVYSALATAIKLGAASGGKKHVRIEVQSFGGPRVGDPTFARAFDKYVGATERHVTLIDCTPRATGVKAIWPDFVSTCPGMALEQQRDGSERSAMLEVGGEAEADKDSSKDSRGHGFTPLANADGGDPTLAGEVLVSVDEDRDSKRAAITEEDGGEANEADDEPGFFRKQLNKFKHKLDVLVNDKIHFWLVKKLYSKIDGFEHVKGYRGVKCPAAPGVQCSSRAQILKTQLACHGLYFTDFQNEIVEWVNNEIEEGSATRKEFYPMLTGGKFEAGK
jgi:hypothetical protein